MACEQGLQRANWKKHIDNMLVNCRAIEHYITDLEETFMTLQHFQMNLNPNECIFEIIFGKFLGFMVPREINANMEKIQAFWEMALLKTVKNVQNLTRRIIALNRLLLKLAERSLPFFRALKRPKDF